MAKTTLSNVVEELELQTEYLDLQSDNMTAFQEQLRADATQRALDDAETQGESGGAPGAEGGAKPSGNKKKGSSFKDALGSSFGSSFGDLAGAAVGLGALGVGIGAFFAGLAIGDKAQSMIGADMQTTKKNMITLGEAFAETPTEGLLKMGVAAAIGAKFGSMKGALNMGFFGAGLGAFFAGIALGDKGMSLLGADGSSVKSMMVNLGEGLGAFSGKSLAAFGALIAFGTAFGSAALVGLPMLGAGLAGFFTAVVGATALLGALGADGSGLRDILVNTAEGMQAIASIDGFGNLLAFLPAAASVGAGIAVLLGAKGLSAVSDAIGSFFGDNEGPNVFEQTADALNTLMAVDYSNLGDFSVASAAIADMGAGVRDLAETDMDNLIDNIDEIAKASAYAIPLFTKMWRGGIQPEGDEWFGATPEMDFGRGLKSVPLKQLGGAFKTIGEGTAALSGEGVERMVEAAKGSQTIIGNQDLKNNGSGANVDRGERIGDATIASREMTTTTIINAPDNSYKKVQQTSQTSYSSGSGSLRPTVSNGSRADAYSAA
jgi:hypothetical protein